MRLWESIEEIRTVQPGTLWDHVTVGRRAPIHGRYFVTGQRLREDGPLVYTVREALSDARLVVIGQRWGYQSRRAAAETAALRLPAGRSAYVDQIVRRMLAEGLETSFARVQAWCHAPEEDVATVVPREEP